MDLMISSVSQGMMWSILAIGVYITFRILGLADLSAEGSFPLGAAVCAKLLVNQVHPFLAVLAALLAGALAGFLTGFMTTKMKIPTLLAGILTMTGLYSINLRVMGQANTPLLGEKTLLTSLENLGLSTTWSPFLLGLLTVMVIVLGLVIFMGTEYGLSLIATGDNALMAEANGIRTDHVQLVGYMISNALIALSGALIAQYNGYADLSMGTGTIVIGLAAIVIGEVLLSQVKLPSRLLSIILGAIIYRVIIDLIMKYIPILPSDIKILSAIVLAIILWSPQVEWKTKKSAHLND